MFSIPEDFLTNELGVSNNSYPHHISVAQVEDYMRHSGAFNNNENNLLSRSNFSDAQDSSVFQDSMLLPFGNNFMKADDFGMHRQVDLNIRNYLLPSGGVNDHLGGMGHEGDGHHGILFSSGNIMDNIGSALSGYDFMDKDEGYDPPTSALHHPSLSIPHVFGDNSSRTQEARRINREHRERSHSKSYKICQYDECKTQASFKFPDEKKVRFCAKHKLAGMVDCRSKRCEHQNCPVIASFNVVGEKKRRFCKLHAQPGMEYVGSKRGRMSGKKHDLDTDDLKYDSSMEESDDKSNALLLGDLRNVDADAINKDDSLLLPAPSDFRMVESGSKLANNNNAGEIPMDISFLPPFCMPSNANNEQTLGQDQLLPQQRYAAAMANGYLPSSSGTFMGDDGGLLINPFSSGMINQTSKMTRPGDSQGANVPKKINKRKICEHPNCETQASFKFPLDLKFRFCARHRMPGMGDFHSRKCEHLGCDTIASFNVVGEKRRRYCKAHALPGMQHIGSKKKKMGPEGGGGQSEAVEDSAFDPRRILSLAAAETSSSDNLSAVAAAVAAAAVAKAVAVSIGVISEKNTVEDVNNNKSSSSSSGSTSNSNSSSNSSGNSVNASANASSSLSASASASTSESQQEVNFLEGILLHQNQQHQREREQHLVQQIQQQHQQNSQILQIVQQRYLLQHQQQQQQQQQQQHHDQQHLLHQLQLHQQQLQQQQQQHQQQHQQFQLLEHHFQQQRIAALQQQQLDQHQQLDQSQHIQQNPLAMLFGSLPSGVDQMGGDEFYDSVFNADNSDGQ